MKEIQTHPIAEIYPVLPADEMLALQQNIQSEGQHHPIVLFEGKILDGRHRYECCLNLGIKPKFTEFKGKSALEFSKSVNLHRRHLTPAQRAAIAVGIANMRQGERTDLSEPFRNSEKVPTSQADAAALLGVSPDTVSKLKQVAEASPKTFRDVRDGKLSVNAAAEKIAEKKAAKEERKDAIGRVIPDDILAEWDMAAETGRRLQKMASDIKCAVERGLAENDPAFGEISNTVISDAAALHYSLSQIVPYSVCPDCQGKLRSNCRICRTRGWISKFIYTSPSVTREKREFIERIAAKGGRV